MSDPTISSYDKHANEWVERVRSGRNIVHRFLEKPAMYAKLPDVAGKSVLCIGCGSGEECAHIKSLGAGSVLGVDASEELIKIASASYRGIEFLQSDMRRIAFGECEFDLAYSSLAMHYLADWTELLTPLRRSLKPGGTFLFSTHHPLWWCADTMTSDDGTVQIVGFSRLKGSLTIHGDYLNRHQRHAELYDGLNVSFFHKPFSEMLSEIRASGFCVRDFVEPQPLPEMEEYDADLYRILGRLPIFVIFELQRN